MANLIFLQAFDKIASYIDYAKNSPSEEIIAGGSYDKRQESFIVVCFLMGMIFSFA